ncbi:hypothetical protein [Flavobacterium phragmitis]|uniref:Uncharacterized protein n=1 Tax=Flavobacterium phragmitis TaxID=739143 RepID=A0A1I1JSU7_9FLAO|nr:hypothetical protein [Flavobacterium phragmitis]SFC51717.1 hypothetical protein SAMN05216297_10198 [Flavobacterium phragmitis]
MKLEHVTVKKDLKRKTSIKEIYSGLTIHIIILVLAYLLAVISFYKNLFTDFTKFSFLVALSYWIIFYCNSQKIIDKNQFKQYTVVGLLIVILSLILLIITNNRFESFSITAFPLFYVGYFRILISLFYKDFTTFSKKPTVLFASKGKWTNENSDYLYVTTKKEIIFSNLLFFGPIVILNLIAYFIINA